MGINVGNQTTTGTINNQISGYAAQLRNIMYLISNLNKQVNGQGNGLAMVEAIGYSSAANASNPGGISDAQYALNMIGYLNTMAAIYYGTAAQSPAFNFDNELSQMWAGQ